MRRSTGVTFAMRDFNRLKCIQADGRPSHQASKVNVRGFWAYIGYREAQNQARRCIDRLKPQPLPACDHRRLCCDEEVARSRL